MKYKKYAAVSFVAALVVFILITIPTRAQEAVYEYKSSGSGIIITKFSTDSESNFELEIPDEIDGIDVIGIGANAFSSISKMTKLVIPSTVTSIEANAFKSCSNLTDVRIRGDNLQTIGDGAFSGCSRLNWVTIPDSVKSIGKDVFSGCSSLEYIELDSNITRIEDRAFKGCRKLSEIIFPENLTYIGGEAFDGCDGMVTITIPKTVTGVGTKAFNSRYLKKILVQSGNSFFRSSEGVLFTADGMFLVQYPAGKSGNYNVPESVSIVRESAFTTDVKAEITIKNNMTTIEKGNFQNAKVICYKNSRAETYMKSINKKPSYIGGVAGITPMWMKDYTDWWYQKIDGNYAKNEWSFINNRWFRFNNSGYLVYGWQMVDNKWYFMNPDGGMVSGDWTRSNDKWYFLTGDGSMKTGWMEWKTKWYYLSGDGSWQTAGITPDGYYVDRYGGYSR